MGVVVFVGTAKGAALLRADEARKRWDVDALRFKGWIVTAAAQDASGRTYVGVSSDVYGAAILVSDDLQEFRHEALIAPRRCREPIHVEDGVGGLV